jgi:hypothetical protein
MEIKKVLAESGIDTSVVMNVLDIPKSVKKDEVLVEAETPKVSLNPLTINIYLLQIPVGLPSEMVQRISLSKSALRRLRRKQREQEAGEDSESDSDSEDQDQKPSSVDVSVGHLPAPSPVLVPTREPESVIQQPVQVVLEPITAAPVLPKKLFVPEGAAGELLSLLMTPDSLTTNGNHTQVHVQQVPLSKNPNITPAASARRPPADSSASSNGSYFKSRTGFAVRLE